MATQVAQVKVTPTNEEFEKLLHSSYLVASEAELKLQFFKQDHTKISSTLILLDLLDCWGHPLTASRYRCPKKGRPANNLLCLPADPSWNQEFIKGDDGLKYKSFSDWGSFAVHLSDLICFRESFKEKYSYAKYLLMCYDIKEDLRHTEYQWQLNPQEKR